MSQGLSLRYRCARTVVVFAAVSACVFHAAAGEARGQTLASYHVGNSLTWDARVGNGLPTLAADAGLGLTTGYHIRCGRPLSFIAANPDDVCVAPNSSGLYTEAFASQAWDAITLQPYSGSTPRQEYTAFKSLVQQARQNPDNLGTRFYLYANWPNTPPADVTFYDAWNDPTAVDPDAGLVRNANGFNWIFDQLKADPDLQGVGLFMIPVGGVLAEVDLRMRGGQIPGFTDGKQLYRDITHLNNLGRFIAANTFLATLFGRDPTGTPTNSDFDTSPGQTVPIVITPALATAVQQAVWDVVSTHPATGVLPGDLDGDGFVGIADLNVVLGNWNQTVPPGNPLADPSGDGFIGIEDLNAVLGNWNAGTPPPAQAPADLPEPAGVLLLGAGLTTLYRRS
jgi:hypothetical protein